MHSTEQDRFPVLLPVLVFMHILNVHTFVNSIFSSEVTCGYFSVQEESVSSEKSDCF